MKIKIIVFIAGAILMALEIAGGRLLSPIFGGSIFVWGSIIGMVLGGLSLGYYFGGKLADKKPRESILFNIFLFAGISILVIPLISSYINQLASNFSEMYQPLISTIGLLFIPSVLLGMVSPYAIKLELKELKDTGKTSGNLYAIATLGSIFGTFLTTFVLIKILPISSIFYSLSGVLLVTSITLRKKKILNIIPIIFLGAVLILFLNINFVNANNQDSEVNIQIESDYGFVEVKTESNYRKLFIDGKQMGGINLSDTLKSIKGWEYFDCMEDAVYTNEVEDVLVLGLGSGLVARKYNEIHSKNVDAVDINEDVIKLTQEYFYVKPSDSLKLYQDDARMFLKKSDKKYDLISMDTFKIKDGYHVIPTHLITQEYYKLIKEHLREDGVFVMMVIPRAYEGNSFYEKEYNTIKSVFKNVYTFHCGSQILIASDKELEFNNYLTEKTFKFIPREDKIFTDDFVNVY